MPRAKKNRVIEQLRKAFPGAWYYDSLENVWCGPEFVVRAYSVYSPRYDGDDDSFTTEYRRTDTGEMVLGTALALFVKE